jgi:hypothetical protein
MTSWREKSIEAPFLWNDKRQMGEAQQPYNNRGLHHVFGRHLGEEISIGTPSLER